MPLTRAWYIFEINETKVLEADLDILFPAKARGEFTAALCNDNFDFYAWLSSIDIRNAVAGFPKDRDMIIDLVEQTEGGIPGVNAAVKAVVCTWLNQQGRLVHAAMSQEERLVSPLVDNLGHMLSKQGRLAEAEQCLREAVDNRRASPALGDFHPTDSDEPPGNGRLGERSPDHGKDSGGRASARQGHPTAMRDAMHRVRDDDVLTTAAVTSLAELRYTQSRGHTALLDVSDRIEDPTAFALVLSTGMSPRELLLDAERMHRLVLAKRRAAGNASAFDSASLLAKVLLESKEMTPTDMNREAEELFDEAHRGQAIAYGAMHAHTLNTLLGKANLCLQRGVLFSKTVELEHAERLYRECEAGFRTAHGNDHPRRIETTAQLAKAMVVRAQLNQ